MRLKDYYRVLGVPPSATMDDIKKSFRQLALKHHPDRNPDNPFSAGHFVAIKEAYHVLGDEKRRYQYDEERWLMGMGSRTPKGGRLSAEWVRGEAAKLKQHMDRIDTYRMNHEAMQQYLLLLLSDEHLAVMENDKALTGALINDVLVSMDKLKLPMAQPVVARLTLLAGNNSELQAAISSVMHSRAEKEKKEQAFRLWVAALIVVLSLIAIFTLTI